MGSVDVIDVAWVGSVDLLLIYLRLDTLLQLDVFLKIFLVPHKICACLSIRSLLIH